MFSKSRVAGLLVASALLTPALAFGATGYISGRAKMFAGPDDGYPVVRRISDGEGVEIHGCLADWSWCDVGFRGERGWLRADKIMGESVSGRVPIATSGRDIGVGTRGFNLDQYWDTYYHGRFDRDRGRWQSYYQQRRQPSWTDGDNDHDHGDDNRDH